jgi:hypothetical protein
MSIWGWGIVVLVAVLLVVAIVRRGGKEGRDLRRDLRRLRKEEGRQPDTASAADLRRKMLVDPMPGRDTTPGGI